MVDSWMYWPDSVWLYRAKRFGLAAFMSVFAIRTEASGKSGRIGTASFLISKKQNGAPITSVITSIKH